MTRDEGKEVVRGFLHDQGLVVEEIPDAPNERRADLRASRASEEYIVEVKSRIPDREYFARLSAVGTAKPEQFLGRTNAVVAQVRDGADQLQATPSQPDAFRLLALVAFATDPETQAIQFRATLYGTVDCLFQARVPPRLPSPVSTSRSVSSTDYVALMRL